MELFEENNVIQEYFGQDFGATAVANISCDSLWKNFLTFQRKRISNYVKDRSVSNLLTFESTILNDSR